MPVYDELGGALDVAAREREAVRDLEAARVREHLHQRRHRLVGEGVLCCSICYGSYWLDEKGQFLY